MPNLSGDSSVNTVPGVLGTNIGGGDGVVGDASGRGRDGEGGRGVFGIGEKVGVEGYSDEGIGVLARVRGDVRAVVAEASRGTAVDASSATGTAVEANSAASVAIKARSQGSMAIDARSDRYIAVQAICDDGVGLSARGTTQAGFFTGDVVITRALTVKGIDMMPGPQTRTLRIAGSVTLRDDEDFGNDEVNTVSLATSDVAVTTTHEVRRKISETVGDEVRLEVDIFASVGLAGSIMINVDARLFEGDSDTTSDLDGRGIYTLHVPPGDSRTLIATVHNQEEDITDDQGFMNLTFTNL